MIYPMDSKEPMVERTDGTKTLGDILHARAIRASMTEEQWFALVKSVANCDQLALHTLYQQTYRFVFTLALRITNSRETAEELTVDVFHDVWRKASTYDPANGSVLGWIMNQARSRAIDRLRYDQRAKRVGDGTNAYAIPAAPTDPQREFEIKEESHILKTALNELSTAEKQVIEMAFFSELTHAQVALTLSEPLGTIKSRIRSGLNKLRAYLLTVR